MFIAELLAAWVRQVAASGCPAFRRYTYDTWIGFDKQEKRHEKREKQVAPLSLIFQQLSLAKISLQARDS